MTRILILAGFFALAMTRRLQSEVSFESDLMEEEDSRSLRDEIILTFVGFGIVLLGVIVKKVQQKGCKRYWSELCNGPPEQTHTEPLMPD